MGYYDKAKQAYEKAILLSSQSKEQNWKQEIAEKHLKTAETYLKKNELKAALGECIKSLRFHPDQPATQIKVASLFWKLKQKKIAEQYLRKFINTKPQNIKARLLLAQWYFESRQIPQAINEWENILRTNPNNKEAKDCLLKTQNLSEWH